MTSGPRSASPRRRYAPRMRPEQRREHLLDCALRIVVRDGYDRVSVGAIAKEAGVTRPVVYSAYDGLEALMLALLERTQNRAYEQTIEVLSYDAGPDSETSGEAGDQAGGPGAAEFEAWLTASLVRFLDRVRAEPDVWRPVLGLVHGTPAVVRHRIQESRDLILRHIELGLRAVLDRSEADGGDDDRDGDDSDGDGPDVPVLAHVILATAEEFARLTLLRPDEFPGERLAATVRRLIRT